jgi:hypothetical protein
MRRLLLPVLTLMLLLVPASAQAHQRWASPTGTTSGACSAASPCRIDHAVGGAVSGDEVIVTSGTYALDASLVPGVSITLRGEAGHPRPRLIGTGNLKTTVVSFVAGGILRHLAVQATAKDADALTLKGAVAEDLVLTSATSDGGKLIGSATGTLLRDSVVTTNASTDGLAGLKLRESGAVMLRNVTVMATNGSAVGIRCEVKANSRATLVNTLVRGAKHDVDAQKADGECTAAYSNIRLARSPDLSAGTGNQEAAPLFVDAANGDFRPAVGSPTIDAGTGDALLGAVDPAGCPRTYGGAPDIGAYEAPCPTGDADDVVLDGPGDAGGDVSPESIIRGVPAPVIGDTVVVAPGRGKVLVRRPGTKRFRALDDARRIPVGSVIDAHHGRVRLVSAIDTEGSLQMGTFWGGRFKVRQRRRGNGMTSLVLRGGSFAGCRRASASGATAVASGKRRRRVRRLWGRDKHGRFRTHGHNSVATTRGTKWLTVDRCDGTLTRVRSGAVAVRDKARRKTVLVKAGHQYVARPATDRR